MAESPLQQILLSAEEVDLAFLVGVLESPLGLTADRAMDEALERYSEEQSLDAKRALATILDREVRYAGSSDIAYAVRWLYKDDAGVGADNLLMDVCDKLHVKLRPIGTFEGRLRRLVRAVVERELLSMTPEQQRDLMAAHDIGVSKRREFIRHLKQKGPVGTIPLLITLAGRESAEKIVTALVVRIIALVVGRHAAAELIASLAARFPWWAEWIGPAAWAFTGAWIAVDLQGPAFRKTIPTILYMGLICLRDGGAAATTFDDA